MITESFPYETVEKDLKSRLITGTFKAFQKGRGIVEGKPKEKLTNVSG